MPATDLSAQSDISEIGILVAVLKFAPKARDLTHLLVDFYFFEATYAPSRKFDGIFLPENALTRGLL